MLHLTKQEELDARGEFPRRGGVLPRVPIDFRSLLNEKTTNAKLRQCKKEDLIIYYPANLGQRQLAAFMRGRFRFYLHRAENARAIPRGELEGMYSVRGALETRATFC